MERATIDLPKVYADHHVEAARKALLNVAGVRAATVSSAWKRAIVEYEPSEVKLEAVHDALRAAGYGPGEDPALPPTAEGKEDDSAWFQVVGRVTQTSIADRQASGDHRKY